MEVADGFSSCVMPLDAGVVGSCVVKHCSDVPVIEEMELLFFVVRDVDGGLFVVQPGKDESATVALLH